MLFCLWVSLVAFLTLETCTALYHRRKHEFVWFAVALVVVLGIGIMTI